VEAAAAGEVGEVGAAADCAGQVGGPPRVVGDDDDDPGGGGTLANAPAAHGTAEADEAEEAVTGGGAQQAGGAAAAAAAARAAYVGADERFYLHQKPLVTEWCALGSLASTPPPTPVSIGPGHGMACILPAVRAWRRRGPWFLCMLMESASRLTESTLHSHSFRLGFLSR
jgi:hypothetical protein